jgi:hypothetical protein
MKIGLHQFAPAALETEDRDILNLHESTAAKRLNAESAFVSPDSSI